jgi:hypothetical protein
MFWVLRKTKQNLQTSQRPIFHILQLFTTKFCDFNTFAKVKCYLKILQALSFITYINNVQTCFYLLRYFLLFFFTSSYLHNLMSFGEFRADLFSVGRCHGIDF